jgi:hypothetical protein
VPVEQTPEIEKAVEDAMTVYREMTEAEREHLFSGMARAVAAFGRSRDVDPLVAFADDVAMTIRMRRLPGYQDRVHASQSRATRYEDAQDVDEVLKQS